MVNRLFSHDDAGNISYDERSGTMYAYAYNARGRLSNLTVGGAQRGAYVYDAFERLSIRTVTNGGTSTTIHTVQDRGGRIIVEATGAGVTTREYIWLDDMPIAVVADVDTVTPKLWFVHADHLDRPILMTDGTKAFVWETIWKPWGAPHSITGTASLDMRFPGQWFQAVSAGYTKHLIDIGAGSFRKKFHAWLSVHDKHKSAALPVLVSRLHPRAS